MKKFLWLGIALSLFISSHAFAAVSFSASTTGSTINASLTGAKGNTDTFRLVVLPNAFPSGSTPAAGYDNSALLFNSFDTDKKTDSNGSISWNLAGYSNINPATTYYVRVVEINGNSTTYATASKAIKTAGTTGAVSILPFTASVAGTTLTASLTGAANLSDIYKLLIQKTPFTGDTFTGTISRTIDVSDHTEKSAVPAGGSTVANISWSVDGLDSNTTYYVRVLEIPKSTAIKPAYASVSQTIKTDQLTLTYSHLVTETSGSSIIVQGAMDPAKVPNYDAWKITLTVSKSPDLSNPTQVNMRSHVSSSADSAEGIADGSVWKVGISGTTAPKGSYYWLLTGLTPGVTYYMQQTLTLDAANSTKDRVERFDGSTGAIVPPATNPDGTPNENLNPSVYKLISQGFPGLTSLPDPIECAAQRAAGLHPKFCDINDVLNYALKLLIGISGVVLVFRLMFEGYQYMVTDVPFLKASSKGAFFSALAGLLLALCSYVILNTINPKLVDQNINVQALSIGIPEEDTDTSPMTQSIGAPTSGASGVCSAGLTTVTVGKSSFPVCSNYKGIPIANNLKNMLTAAYAAGITLQGGGWRSSAAQTQLRKEHCNGDTSNPKTVCHPPTATVGHSNHESGLAFDFTCDGPNNSIQARDNKCYIWLNSNAAGYGFKNLPSEPWHWSWNGH